MNILRMIQRWWWRRQRALDLEILWPICKERAPTIDAARALFMYHAFNDTAWIGEYKSELPRIIGELK